ncbi:hypothetical protein [Pelagibacterium luteolum]|uniref:Transcriptional regulator n=1 Tax=Pelagibacterium luteolum TaxID=440168 RepID=A0A1G8A9G3_9HYPH|nr:hypothetical protein [Pelagibacterium luteolum]SDH16980.1 hypothetical protein SAMN04487974_1276 [Pelagibacterium luteolum]
MIPTNPADRQPKGDHNRRLSLGLEVDDFARVAGLTPEQVYEYEMTSIDHRFDVEVALRYGEALEKLEANPPASQSVQG